MATRTGMRVQPVNPRNPEALDKKADALIKRMGLGKHEFGIKKLVRRAVRLDIDQKRVEDLLGVSTSKWGGAPDLPPSCEPPPLPLLCQVNLSHLPAFLGDEGLPSSGLLSFFFDLESEPAKASPGNHNAHVIYSPSSASFERKAKPPGPSLPVGAMMFTPEITIPDPRTADFDGLIPSDAETELKAYEELFYALAKLTNWNPARHRLLGHSGPIQGDMQVECALLGAGLDPSQAASYDGLEARLPEARQWRLLLQLDSCNVGLNWSWWGCGRLYFFVRESDLRQLNFRDIRAFIQDT